MIERDPAYGLSALHFTQTWLRAIYEDSLTVPDRSMLEPSSRQLARAGSTLCRTAARRAALPAGGADEQNRRAVARGRRATDAPGFARTAIAAEGGYGRNAAAAFDIAARFMPFTPVFNVTGQPAVTVPAGVGGDGLPFSVQLVGRPGEEATLFSVAAQLEAAAPWSHRRPPE